MGQQRQIQERAAQQVPCDGVATILHAVQVVRVKQAEADIDKVKEREGEQNKTAGDPEPG